MKKLVIKILIMLMFVCGLLMVLEYFSIDPKTKEVIARLTNSEDYLSQGSGTDDIIPIIQSVKEADSTTVLVLGDSIARQIFPEFSCDLPDTKIACVNAAIDITGQYMLAEEYLNSHPYATDIWLYVHPLSMTRTFDLDLGYGYAVMPFAIEGSIQYLDDSTLNQMASVYGRFALCNTVASLVDSSPLNRKIYMSYIRMHHTEYAQSNAYEISSLYIEKFRSLCEERGVDFHLSPCPSTEFFRDRIEETRDDFMNSPLYDMYPDYLDEVYYFPTEWSDDLSHFGERYANRETYVEVVRNAYEESCLDRIIK